MRKLTIALLSVLAFGAHATRYTIPEQGRLIGNYEAYQPTGDESLADIAERYHVGFLGLLEANPGTDPYLPLESDMLQIPTQMLLPDVPHEGIVINLAELRLYFFEPDTNYVHVFPIGIGRIGRETPEMVTRITQLIENPTWTPTQNIRNEYLEKHNIVLPQVVPAGPENPLGTHALRLAYGQGEYLIHGTNKDFGIGMRVSSGCIRLAPPDIVWLFARVNQEMKVTVVNQPLKASVEPDGSLFVEVHQPLSQQESEQNQFKAVPVSNELLEYVKSDQRAETLLYAALRMQAGLPVEIQSGVVR
uniref:L,D-transpeptidase family protein n=1 Tax=Thaumasiovibrio occultus TaxID=1891184 RepID=UPI000B3557EA|nr:L,D-transpeptidase family protein [Thaumasiovibrio occultus]